MPKIQNEVSLGLRVGILRQIFLVMIIAEWIRQSTLGTRLKEIGFLDCNDPGKYKLNVVGDEPLQMKEQCLKMFKESIWQYTQTFYYFKRGRLTRRFYIVGGISFI